MSTIIALTWTWYFLSSDIQQLVLLYHFYLILFILRLRNEEGVNTVTPCVGALGYPCMGVHQPGGWVQWSACVCTVYRRVCPANSFILVAFVQLPSTLNQHAQQTPIAAGKVKCHCPWAVHQTLQLTETSVISLMNIPNDPWEET